MDKHSNLEAPVLLIGFNRPDTTQQVFDKIREVQPAKLYFAVDGPRHNQEGEAELVANVKQIVKQVDWQCNVKCLFRGNNLGCKFGVSGAISWALENEDRVIIVEDDIVAVPSFFHFAEELLEKYKDDDRIAMISGNNYTPINTIKCDYLFSKYGHIWGWATWKRVWDKFDVNLPYLKEDIEKEYLKTLGLQTEEMKYFEKYARNILYLIENNKMNAWGYQFSYYRIRNSLLSIVPRVNLASNIGTTSSRTDNIALTNEHFYAADNNFNLSNHPDNVACDLDYDKHHFKKHINRKSPLITRIIRKALTTFKLV